MSNKIIFVFKKINKTKNLEKQNHCCLLMTETEAASVRVTAKL